MSKFFKRRRGLIVGTASGAAMLLLAGCVENAADFNPNAAPRSRAPGVPVALISLVGAPETVTSRLSVSLTKQATRRDILIVGIDGTPRYQVRGYVSLQAATEGLSNLVWTFDLYDAQRKRAQRISGAEKMAARNEDWSLISDLDLERVSSNALDDIAEFLAPQSVPVASQIPVAPTVSRAASLKASDL